MNSGLMYHVYWNRAAGAYLSRDHDKTNKETMRPAKTQISLGIRPVWSESSFALIG